MRLQSEYHNDSDFCQDDTFLNRLLGIVMHRQSAGSTDELELILQLSGRKISQGIEAAGFLDWFRTSIPQVAPQFANAMSNADGGSGSMIYSMGRALWNAMPQPSNRYKTRPLPKPDRNARCPCGSGRKFKQCCAQLDPPSELFGTMNLLRYVLDDLSKAALKRLDTAVMNPEALDDVARQWAYEGEVERALMLLEPLFDAGAKPVKHAELLLDTLFDIWPPGYIPQRRRRLAERLAENSNPAVACVALHRCIVMLADEGNSEQAWTRFHAGMRKYPSDVNFASLEITLLLRDGRAEEAKGRAEFWAHRLRRQGAEYYPYVERLLAMVASDENKSALDRLRDESPLIDMLAHLIESPAICIDGYVLHPGKLDEPIVLIPNAELAATERRWFEAVGGSKPSQVMLDSGDEPLNPEKMVTMLEEEPELLNSFDVLDDLSASLLALDDEWGEFGALMELVMLRAETMLFFIVTGRQRREWITVDDWRDELPEQVRQLPWVFLENRPALRLMARHITHLKYRSVSNFERWLPRAQALLRINPDDNHGYRELVSMELLRQRHPRRALALLDQYPDDAMSAVVMNRALALFMLGRQDEAADCLRKGGTYLREIRKSITQERYSKPRDADDSCVMLGGRDEAWFYRQDMHIAWKDEGAIEWLKQLPVPRKRRESTVKK